jgi:hypothetical protein
MTLGPETVTLHDRPDGWTSDCAVEAPASDLFMLLWNRIPHDALDVRGDRSVLDAWRATVRVRWTD